MGVVGRAAAIVLGSVVCACSTGVERRPRDADVEAVRGVLTDVLDRFEAGDAEGLLAHYADDAVWMFPERRDDLDKAAALDYYRGLFENVELSGYSADRHVEVHGDWAVARITYEGTIRPREGGAPRTGYSRHITTLKRGADGTWKISWDIFNLP